MRTRPLIVYAMSVLIFSAAGARNLLIPLYADSLGANRAEIGLLFSSFAIAAAFFAIPGGLIADRIGARRVIIVAAVIGGLAQLGAGLGRELWILFASQVVGGFANGAMQTALLMALAASVR